MVSSSAPQAGHLALSVLLNLLRYPLSGMWVSLSCEIRLAELRVMSGVLIAPTRCGGGGQRWPMAISGEGKLVQERRY